MSISQEKSRSDAAFFRFKQTFFCTLAAITEAVAFQPVLRRRAACFAGLAVLSTGAGAAYFAMKSRTCG